ncbi:MAG: hypothetical protein ACRENK_15550 [Gemmatimonadaceae bacterium]
MKRVPKPAAIVPVVVSPPKIGLFRNAITEDDGHSVNVGYFSLFWVLIVVLTVVPLMVVAAFIQQYYDEARAFPFTELRDGLIGVGSVFGATLTALGVFLWGDSRKTPTPQTTTNITQVTTP